MNRIDNMKVCDLCALICIYASHGAFNSFFSKIRKFSTDLVNATTMAEQAINDKSLTKILPNVRLQVIKSAGGCSLDTVMRTFVNYYIQPQRVLGVLGPPCSEAVEPIAGMYSIASNARLHKLVEYRWNCVRARIHNQLTSELAIKFVSK